MGEGGHRLLLPQYRALDLACEPLESAFRPGVFLVGSCLERDDYRDVDVRAILFDDQFTGMFPTADPEQAQKDARWLLVCMSISLHLRRCSELPVDFQIQQMTDANANHKKKRSALGQGIWRYQQERLD